MQLRLIGPVLVAIVASLAACRSPAQPTASAGPSDPATCTVPGVADSKLPTASTGPDEPGRFIVVLKGGPDPSAKPGGCLRSAAATLRAKALGATVLGEYHFALNGFTARLDAGQTAAVQQDPDVAYVAADQTVTLGGTQSPAPWGLDRVDQRVRPLNNTFTYQGTGGGVTVFVVDTGIRATHVEFGGRVSGGRDFIGDGRGTSDCLGHGTHVAGLVGGATHGVAKRVRLVPVRVFPCGPNTATSTIVAGIDWVTANHAGPSVMNLSLTSTSGGSRPMDDAVTNAANAGVVVVTASGNFADDACGYSPARAPVVITVANATGTDGMAVDSDYGSCVDLFAPGSSVPSAWYTGDTATRVLSGTSMASPVVAGVAARYLQANPTASARQVSDAIVGQATSGVLSSIGTGTPNLLLFSDVTSDTCASGYVWREAFAGDHVCVTPGTRSQAAADNAAATGRWTSGAFGPDTCVIGYVWREASRTDHVCVTPALRSQAAADNAHAAARRAVAPRPCRTGYVWREAFTTDYICVMPATRSAVAADSNASNDRRNPSGPAGITSCQTGFVWRLARESDQVCVTPTAAAQIDADVNQAIGHTVA